MSFKIAGAYLLIVISSTSCHHYPKIFLLVIETLVLYNLSTNYHSQQVTINELTLL